MVERAERIIVSLSVQTCISKTFTKYLDQVETEFLVEANGYNYGISVARRDFPTPRYDCGFKFSEHYKMLRSDIPNLRAWCSYNPGFGRPNFTFKGLDNYNHTNCVNIQYTAGMFVMFNFHVYVVEEEGIEKGKGQDEKKVEPQGRKLF